MRTSRYLEQQVKQDVKQYGLNMTEFAVLEFLYHKGRQPIQQISEKILIASSSTTYVIDQLGKKGLVNRALCQKDKRVTYAELTEKGTTLMATVFPKHAEKIMELFSVLTESEQETLLEALKKISRY
ncbi:MarR family transcriptional regulator [Vagococcus lutrae]|uniref:MarR family transcriptional regulator n=2 Tax=Vagococcus lutrae TaxID=81947 RepID=A0AAE9XJW8_9ENTE|nr:MULTISPECIES: MarR family transcriptional regulator [Vagococcus]MCO7150174.1 MarR family transcriptional regulator [Vagococcus lutrae]MDT2801230.1 MarR family transcriptional regulator [Vagococcus lutrae]MDT2807543.1 MarR family transcriptional regulator [Vagococcus lutrae]MDT2811877.1 MarR family transcriptional regulator [Vagococcus lutrae]MDT2818279.1 MarR family transcriptional regulator [Vagococcus lutrae]